MKLFLTNEQINEILLRLISSPSLACHSLANALTRARVVADQSQQPAKVIILAVPYTKETNREKARKEVSVPLSARRNVKTRNRS